MTSTAEPTKQIVQGNKLRGRVAFVTGGTRGIGAAISRSLATQGATVAAGYARNTSQADQFLADLNATGRNDVNYSVHKGDVASAEDCRRTIDEVIAEHGRIDILINNAGITIDRTVLKMEDDDWDKVISVNLSGAFYLAQAVFATCSSAVPAVSSTCRRSSARQATSARRTTPHPRQVSSASPRLLPRKPRSPGKAGLLTPDSIGVTVNTVTPGFVATEMVESIPEKVLGRITDSIPVKRLADPQEIARVVHFLAADASSYITGQVWGVNGGLDM